MIHYHGGPIVPETAALRAWRGRHAFVSYAKPQALGLAASVAQSFALDNGAYTAWRKGRPVADWGAYYEWCWEWLEHPACDWAVIPDAIGGTEEENDALVAEWPHAFRGVPVWHLNESPERLVALCTAWPRVALGSAPPYDVAHPSACLARLADVLPEVAGSDGRPWAKLHGLRMLSPAITSRVPFASADSTTVGRNVGLDVRWRGTYAPATREARADVLVERLEGVDTPANLDRLGSGWRERTLWEVAE